MGRGGACNLVSRGQTAYFYRALTLQASDNAPARKQGSGYARLGATPFKVLEVLSQKVLK